MSEKPGGSLREKIWSVASRIPAGRVATYGQIAALAGAPSHARQVGYAMAALPEGSTIPWHRVVNREGRVSARSDRREATGVESVQRRMLEAEGVVFDESGRIDLERYAWDPGPGRMMNAE